MKKAMTPRHPRWNEFTERLEGAEGINYRVDGNGKGEWKCHGNHKLAISILETMEDIDIPKSLKYFEKHGGYCDCEILLNVQK